MVAVSVRVIGADVAARRVAALATAVREWGQARIEIGNTAFYEHYVREGTRPHVITPRHAKALSWPGAAHPVRAVFHPGTKPNPYADAALDRIATRTVERMERSLDAVAAGAPASTARGAISASRDDALRTIRAAAPNKSGHLRRSFYTRVVR